jgi:hypothetical protein
MSDDQPRPVPSPLVLPSRPAGRRSFYVLVAVGVTVLAAWTIRAARDASTREKDRLNFSMVGMSLAAFSEYHGRLPEATIKRSSYDRSTAIRHPQATDRPLFSWRVEIWPYLENWDGSWDPSQPWDHPLNKQLVEFSPVYAYDAAGREQDYRSFPETNLLAITGPGTAFGDGTAPPMALKDVSPNAILVVETRASGIPWPAPGDFDIRTMPQTINAPDGKGISGRNAGGFHVIFADRRVWFLSDKVPFDTLRKFFTTKDAAKYNREELLGPFALYRGPR